MKIEAKSHEECLVEAAQCERLARLARSKTARMTMNLSTTVWRKRAQEAILLFDFGNIAACPDAHVATFW